MYYTPDDEHSEFLYKLKRHHEYMIASANEKFKRFEKLISYYPSYKNAINGKLTLDNKEENCKIIGELEKLKNDLKSFIKDNYIYSDEEMFYEPNEVMRKIKNRIIHINRFVKEYQKVLHRANAKLS